jgi:hypothetical protein
MLAWTLVSTPVVAGSACAFFGCVDLFHSTSFETLCDLDANAPGCLGSREGGLSDRSTNPHHDAAGDHVEHDAGADTRSPHDSGHDVAAPPTDFCSWSLMDVESHAAHACTWLAACAGNVGQNQFGTCYELALLAYGCAANPNQQVHGPVHAYWDALWQVTTCAEVRAAIFTGGVPTTCVSAGPACGSGSAASIAITCSDASVSSAQYCPAQGYTCASGACFVDNPASCGADAAPPSCAGNTLHACRNVVGQSQATDVGKDCTHFGAGACVVDNDAGVAGCAPNDAGAPCAPSIHGSCSEDDGGGHPLARGCATGVTETVDCSQFGAVNPSSANCVTDAAAPSIELPAACFIPSINGGSTAPACSAGGAGFTAYAGPSGVTTVLSCTALGLADCETTQGYPGCTRPTGAAGQ